MPEPDSGDLRSLESLERMYNEGRCKYLYNPDQPEAVQIKVKKIKRKKAMPIDGTV